jgi:Transposase DDE domain group 1
MSPQILPVPIHPESEPSATALAAQATLDPPVPVDTLGRRFHVEWDPHCPVTPLGQLVFFAQFLAAGGLYADWVSRCPLRYGSPNAPKIADVLGTWVLATLGGAWRYAHVTALRGDSVNPPGLGMEKVVSEDSLRRAFQDQDAAALRQWQTQALAAAYETGLDQPWICDLDVTVKPIFGHQEGAEIGYNPHKPGRPSHAYHTLFVRRLRLALDVEVHSGKEHAAMYGLANVWQVLEGLPVHRRPWLLCGDASYGNERVMVECESHHQKYLFRLRGTKKVYQLIRALEQRGGWTRFGDGLEAIEGQLQLTGWTRQRRVVVMRRRKEPKAQPAASTLLPWAEEQVVRAPEYEYQVLVTDMSENLATAVALYRQRADAENVYDELKNQWGWGGFTTRDLLRCQVAARMVALVYNWWSLFVRCAEPERPREAITSRPLLLHAIGRVITTGRQTILRLTSNHAEAAHAQKILTDLSMFLSGLMNAAEQLTSFQRWQRIWHRILQPLLRPTAELPAPTG